MRHALFGLLILSFAMILTMFLSSALQQLGQTHHQRPAAETIAVVGP